MQIEFVHDGQLGTELLSKLVRASGTGSSARLPVLRFDSEYQDTKTGLYHLGARYLDTHLGRFTQADPSHQESNNYTFAGADPVNRSDPSGLFFGEDELTGCVKSGVVQGGLGFLGGGPALAGILGGLGCAEGALTELYFNAYGDEGSDAYETGGSVSDLEDLVRAVY